MILFAMLKLNENSVFPGINAIYPVLGTALIIYSGTHQSTIISRMLGTKGFVAIGLISYSLYLWHWPVTVSIPTCIGSLILISHLSLLSL